MSLRSVILRARSTSRRGVVVVSLLSCVATVGAVVGAEPVGAQPSDARVPTRVATEDALEGFLIQVGAEERVYGPSGLTDFPFFSERNAAGKLLGFISNNDSYRTTSKSNKTLRDPRVILKRGRAGTFDKCGAWLIGSVYKQTANTWIALYHAEAAGQGDNDRCIFHDDSVVASVGRAVSRDSGKTWTKTGQVLTQDSRLTGPKAEDATMGRLVQYGQYLYFFYAASTGNTGTGLQRRLHVARSHVDNLGVRGSWTKWHCSIALGRRSCDWTEPGLGGKSTALGTIDPMARVIVPNTYLHRNIALYASGSRGFRLWISNTAAGVPPVDPNGPVAQTAWAGSVQFYPEVSTQSDPQVDNWNRSSRAKQLYAYPSIVSTTGDSNTSDQTFYIYYVKLFPGADFTHRYLMRRKVTLALGPVALHRVALTTYFRRSDGRRVTSTERPMERAFRVQSTNGYLLGKDRNGWVDVFDCVKRGDHRLRTNRCGLGERAIRRVGWIRPTAGDSATVPIFRCFNKAKGNHFASTSRRCLGFKREARIGYGLPSL